MFVCHHLHTKTNRRSSPVVEIFNFFLTSACKNVDHYANIIFNFCSTTLMQFLELFNGGLVLSGRKEMFYLTRHSTHFNYDYMV